MVVKGKGQKKELTKDVHFRVGMELHAELIRMAKADDRDLGSMVRILVIEAIRFRDAKALSDDIKREEAAAR